MKEDCGDCLPRTAPKMRTGLCLATCSATEAPCTRPYILQDVPFCLQHLISVLRGNQDPAVNPFRSDNENKDTIVKLLDKVIGHLVEKKGGENDERIDAILGYIRRRRTIANIEAMAAKGQPYDQSLLQGMGLSPDITNYVVSGHLVQNFSDVKTASRNTKARVKYLCLDDVPTTSNTNPLAAFTSLQMLTVPSTYSGTGLPASKTVQVLRFHGSLSNIQSPLAIHTLYPNLV